MGSGNSRVLVVEDSVLVAMAIESALAERGIEAVVAGSLAAARERLATLSISAALLDIHLPDGNALELAAQLQARGCPVAICTGSDSSSVPSVDGIASFLKPVRAEDLAEWAERAMASRK